MLLLIFILEVVVVWLEADGVRVVSREESYGVVACEIIDNELEYIVSRLCLGLVSRNIEGWMHDLPSGKSRSRERCGAVPLTVVASSFS